MSDLISFIRESNRIEGILRPPTKREIEAHERLLGTNGVGVADLEIFVSGVQPDAVLRREAWQNVRVGSHIAPPGGQDIERALDAILRSATDPYRTHQAYETLHPFTDGNGRSGRALWLYMMGEGALRLGFLHLWYYQSLQAIRNA